MKKIKILRGAVSLLLIGMLTLTGCSSEKKGSSGKDDTDSQGVGYTSSVYDRTKVEGKMAVYYMSSGINMSTWHKQIACGDAMIMIMPDGTVILNDCGLQPEGAYVLERLQKLGVKKIDAFIASHPHSDHVGGFPIIARHMEIGHIYLPPEDVMERSDSIGLEIMDIIEEKNIPYTHLKEGDEFEIAKDVTARVFNPAPGFAKDTKINVNESSLVMKFTYKKSSFLMTGDAANNPGGSFGYATETALFEKYGNELQADVLKIGHHGNADTLSSMDFKKAVSPKITVTLTGFPRDVTEHLKNLSVAKASLNTGLDGDILIYTSGDGVYDVQVTMDRAPGEYEILDTDKGHMVIK